MTAIHRAFLHGWKRSRPGFAIQIRVGARVEDRLELLFVGITPALSATLDETELIVYADWQGEIWDMLLWLDAFPKQITDGWICGDCPAEARRFFTSPVALWCDHLFEPLLQWVNEESALAEYLCLYGSIGHSTSARLETGNAFYWEKPTIRIPLRVPI